MQKGHAPTQSPLFFIKSAYVILFFISQNEAIWLAEEPVRAGRFFASDPLWNATARCEMQLRALVFAAKTEEWGNF
jgi:hypothetical protein